MAELPGPDLLFSLRKSLNRNELLAAIPGRAEADELLDGYISSMDMAFSLLHLPSFRRQYNRFWAQPSEAPLMWVAMLFCIFALATRFRSLVDETTNFGSTGDPADLSFQSARVDFYREKVVHCLILGNYTKCPPYTVEALLLYYMCEYFRSPDSQFAIRIVLSMVVQIAYRMGYHRDPSKFANITPFKAEMRRRVWHSIVQMDLTSSSQLGLPIMISESSHNVMQPRNLLDEDYDENSQELPPSRPDTELTPMLFGHIRHRFLKIVAKIMRLSNSPTLPDYHKTMRLDSELEEAYTNIPAQLKPLLAKYLHFNNTFLDMRRIYMGVGHLKAQLQLHRPFLLLGRTEPRYARSRIICIDAALEILEFQNVLDKESVVGGRLWVPSFRLWSSIWRLSSLVNENFLLATTVLCVDVDRDVSSPLQNNSPMQGERVRFGTNQPTRAEIIETLIRTYHIWLKTSDQSHEAKKAAETITLVLRKASVHIGSEFTPRKSSIFSHIIC
jgi:hypothetical protein